MSQRPIGEGDNVGGFVPGGVVQRAGRRRAAEPAITARATSLGSGVMLRVISPNSRARPPMGSSCTGLRPAAGQRRRFEAGVRAGARLHARHRQARHVAPRSPRSPRTAPSSAVDFRGHGRSAGRSSVGRDETLDLDAAVAWARARGYGPVAVVGFSMGGAVSLRHAALGASRPDAVVSVSAPARWYVRESSAMRRVHWLLESPLGPPVGRLFGIRLGEPWDELPTSPIETIGQVAVPILLVHGTADRYFGPAHAIALGRAARTAAEVWVVPGMGHGETGTTAETTHRIARWAEAATAGEGSGTPGEMPAIVTRGDRRAQPPLTHCARAQARSHRGRGDRAAPGGGYRPARLRRSRRPQTLSRTRRTPPSSPTSPSMASRSCWASFVATTRGSWSRRTASTYPKWPAFALY